MTGPRHFPLLLIALLALAVLVLLPPMVQSQGKKKLRVLGPIAAFPKGASVERGGKGLKGAKKGTLVQQGDLVKGGAKNDLDLYLGSFGTLRLRRGSRLKIEKVEPARPRAGARVDVQTKLERGAALVRLRDLGGQSRFELGTAGAITAAKGTAFRVRWNAGRNLTSVLVAEGTVGVSLPDAPAQELEVGARQKVVVGNTLPAAPEPADADDEAEIQELLSLPLPGARGNAPGGGGPVAGGGAGLPAFVTRHDPTAPWLGEYAGSVRDPKTRRYRFVYTTRWRPQSRNVVRVQAPDHFYYVDAAGKQRDVGKGLYFEDISPDGRTLYGTQPNRGMWAVDPRSGARRQITREPVGNVLLSPDGKRFLAGLKWKKTGAKWEARELRSALFQLDKGAARRTGNLNKGVPRFVNWLANDRLLASDYNAQRLTLWNFSGAGPIAQEYSWPGRRLDISPTGAWIIFPVADDENTGTTALRTRDMELLQHPQLRYFETVGTRNVVYFRDEALVGLKRGNEVSHVNLGAPGEAVPVDNLPAAFPSLQSSYYRGVDLPPSPDRKWFAKILKPRGSKKQVFELWLFHPSDPARDQRVVEVPYEGHIYWLSNSRLRYLTARGSGWVDLDREALDREAMDRSPPAAGE